LLIASSVQIGGKVRERVRRARAYITGGGLGPFVVRATAGSAAVRISSAAASFAVAVLLARGLGVQGYGYFAVALAVITIAGMPGELGLPKLVTREVAIASAKHDRPALFGVLKWADRTCWTLSTLIALGVGVAAIVLLGRGSRELGWAILLGLPVIPFHALSKIRGGALQGLRYISLGQIPSNLLRPLLLGLMLGLAFLSGLKVSASVAMALNSVTAAAALLIAHMWLRARIGEAAPAKVVRTGRKWLASSIPLGATDVMAMLQMHLTILLIGIILTSAEGGLLRIALATATAAAAPITVLARVNMPMIAKLHSEGDMPRLQKLVRYSAYAQAAGVLMLSLPLLVIPGPLLSFVFGAEFAPAADALRIIAFGQTAGAAFGPNIILLNMTHHERRVLRAMAIALVLNVIFLVLLLAAGLGIIAAAVAFIVSLLSWNVLMWLDGRRLLAIDTSVLGRLLPIRDRLAKS